LNSDSLISRRSTGGYDSGDPELNRLFASLNTGNNNSRKGSGNAGIIREEGAGVVGDGGSSDLLTITLTTPAAGDAVTETAASAPGRQTLPSSRQQQHPSMPPRASKKGKKGSRRRRKKNLDRSESDGSNASALDRSNASDSRRRRKKNLDQSESDGDASPLDRSNTSELESRSASGAQSGGGEEGSATMDSSGAHKSSSHRESEDGGEAVAPDGGDANSGSAVKRGKLKKELPRKIRLPKRGKMEKGISNLSIRLTSSLRRSVSHNALKAVNDNATNVADVDAGGIGRSADAQKANIKRKPRHTARGRLERGGGGDNNNEDSAGLAPRAGRKRRPKKLDDLVSSFRQSLQKSFTGDNVAATAAMAVENSQSKKLARAKEKEAGSPINPKKGLTRAMSSMKMSMRKNFIGELSDDSDSSSSSSEDDSSSSDDDSSSSSSDNSSTGRPKNRKQMQKAVSSMLVYKMGDDVAAASQKHRRHTTMQVRQIHDNSHVSPRKQEQQHAKHRLHQHQACDVPRSDATDRHLLQANADGSSDRRPGSDRRLDQGNTAELHESELTQTNDYLPHGRLDATPEEAIQQHHLKGRRSSERPSHRSARSKSRSSRSNSSDQRQRHNVPKGSSQRSMGSKSQSSRSIYSAQWQESPSNSDHNGSRPSIHKQESSKSSRRSKRGGGTRQENTSESEGGGGGRSHRNHGGGTAAAKQRQSKLKRHNNATDFPGRLHDSSHQNRRKKEHQSHRHKKLAQLKSSLTSSLSSVTKGKSLSDTATLALKDSRIGGVDRAKGSQHGSSRPRSTRGLSQGGRVTSERSYGDRGGPTKSSHERHSPTRSGGDSDNQRKKSLSTKDKRPSPSNKKRHSKHKGDSGRGAQHQHQGADEGGAKKKSKRKAASTTAV